MVLDADNHIYYRLKQVDLDGSVSYSYIVQVNFDDSKKLKVYPNPASNLIIIQVEGIEGHKVLLYDITGKLLEVTRDNRLNVSKYNNGTYLLKLTDDKGEVLEIEKIIISK